MCVCPREGWARLGGLAPWLTALGRAQPLWLQLGQLLLCGGQCMEGQRLSWLLCRWAKAAVCQEERAVGTASDVVPRCAGAHFGALPSLSEVSWSSCCPRVCAELWGLATGSQFLALKTIFGWCLAFCDVKLRGEQSLSRLKVTPLLEGGPGTPCPLCPRCCWCEFPHSAVLLCPEVIVPPFISSC